jgi:hypothetical protein
MPGNLATLALLLALAGLPTLSAASLDQLSVDQLEHRKRAIDIQLGRITGEGARVVRGERLREK